MASGIWVANRVMWKDGLGGKAAAVAVAAPTPAPATQAKREEPVPAQKEVKAGPCGLPAKCVIL